MKMDLNLAKKLYTQMLLIRRFEEKCVELYSAEKIRGFLHLYDGEEAIAAGIIPLLEGKDRLVATYREHGHALARGVPMGAVLAEMYGKANGCSGGRGGARDGTCCSRGCNGHIRTAPSAGPTSAYNAA